MQKVTSVKKKIGNYSFYLSDIIGSGYISKVYKCFKRSSPNEFLAIKVISLDGMGHANFKLLKNEIKILETIKHPNILQFHEVHYTQNNCYVITDLCEGGNLQEYIDSTPKSKEKKENISELYLIFEQILEGCQYLNKMNIIHRDIKPANIFNQNGVWKIGDFGFARFLDSNGMILREKYRIGSPFYMPLETLRDNIYSHKTDSFALGILLFNLFTKQFPWRGNNRKELLSNLLKKDFPKFMLEHVDPFVAEFICGLVEIQMENRYSVSDFILNPCETQEEIEIANEYFNEISVLNLCVEDSERETEKHDKRETIKCTDKEESILTCCPSSVNCDSDKNIDIILQEEEASPEKVNPLCETEIQKIEKDRQACLEKEEIWYENEREQCEKNGEKIDKGYEDKIASNEEE